jgi:hypothetical protein
VKEDGARVDVFAFRMLRKLQVVGETIAKADLHVT